MADASNVRSVGRVEWEQDGLPAVATLHSDRTWTVTIGGEPAPNFDRNLPLVYEDWDRGPEWALGESILPDLAVLMRGRSILFDLAGPSPDILH